MADSPASVERTRRARRAPSRRHLVLHVHLSGAALTVGGGREESAGLMGRVEDPHLPVTADTIRRWCGDVHTRLTVLPVLDLEQEKHHGAYEIPARMREQVVARDVTCVFPRCATPARACDLDHVVPFDHAAPAAGPGQRGPTATDNLAPLCRRHHRLKTTGRIRYRVLGAGAYEWTFPDGTRALVDRTGTRSLGGPATGVPHLLLSPQGPPQSSTPEVGANLHRPTTHRSAPSQRGALPTPSASRAASRPATVATRPRRRPARILLPRPGDHGEPPF